MSGLEINSSGSFELPEDTVWFYTALSQVSSRPGGVGDLFQVVEQLAAWGHTAPIFSPLNLFNQVYSTYGFDVACESVDLNQPAGVPVCIVAPDNQPYPGVVVALTETLEEHGAYLGIAVADFGNGPETTDVSLWATEPGIVYRAEY